MNERELFLAACEFEDAAARNVFLDQKCSGDTALRHRLQRMFAAESRLGNFLETPAVDQLMDLVAMTTADHQIGETDGGSFIGGLDQSNSSAAVDILPDRIELKFLEPTHSANSLGRLGNYEVLEVIGTGAFGIVLKARDEVLQRVVAIKVLAPEIAATSPARKRFLREAHACAAIRHENVVHVYTVCEQPIPYLVMEYIPGLTIQQKIDTQGPLEIVDAVNFARQIASGLAAAHGNGLIHRDIKPSNILLEGGKIKITDFGLARAVDDASVTQSGLIAGTPMYMSPEQALARDVDHRTDLFSLGSVLYVMACGRPPFRASTTVGVLKRVLEDNPRSMREILHTVPEWLCNIVAKLHQKSPDDRYSSASELASVLGKCLIDLEHGIVPSIPAPRNIGIRRVPAARYWTVGLFLFAILCAIFVTLQLQKKDGPKQLATSSAQDDTKKSNIVIGEPIELTPLLNRSCIWDGSFDDISFVDDRIAVDATSRSRNLWINFLEIEGDDLVIQTEFRLLDPNSEGEVKLVFATRDGSDCTAFINFLAIRPIAGIKQWNNRKPADEIEVDIPDFDLTNWTQLRYVVGPTELSFYLNNQLVAQQERLHAHSGFISLGCRKWRCDFRNPTVTVTKKATVSTNQE